MIREPRGIHSDRDVIGMEMTDGEKREVLQTGAGEKPALKSATVNQAIQCHLPVFVRIVLPPCAHFASHAAYRTS